MATDYIPLGDQVSLAQWLLRLELISEYAQDRLIPTTIEKLPNGEERHLRSHRGFPPELRFDSTLGLLRFNCRGETLAAVSKLTRMVLWLFTEYTHLPTESLRLIESTKVSAEKYGGKEFPSRVLSFSAGVMLYDCSPYVVLSVQPLDSLVKHDYLFIKKESANRQIYDSSEDTKYDENPQPKGNTMSEKNAAAMLRNDTKTVHVNAINPSATSELRNLTYVTHLDLQKGDTVVVPFKNTYLVAQVLEVDTDVNIQPNSDIEYRWVVGKVDFEAYEANHKRNVEITDILRQNYQSNARKAFQQLLLGNVTEDGKDALTKLLG